MTQLSLLEQALARAPEPPAVLAPTARATDPETSHAAAARINPRGDRLLVARILYANPDGLTDFELAAIAGRAQTSLGVRRGELTKQGYIEHTGTTRPAPSGAAARVWRITATGRLWVDENRQAAG